MGAHCHCSGCIHLCGLIKGRQTTEPETCDLQAGAFLSHHTELKKQEIDHEVPNCVLSVFSLYKN